jgi:hypothetical protein
MTHGLAKLDRDGGAEVSIRSRHDTVCQLLIWSEPTQPVRLRLAILRPVPGTHRSGDAR